MPIKEAQTFDYLVTAQEIEELLSEYSSIVSRHLEEHASVRQEQQRRRRSSVISLTADQALNLGVIADALSDEEDDSSSGGGISAGSEEGGAVSNIPKKVHVPLRGTHPPSIDDEFPNLRGHTQLDDDFDLYEYLGDDSWGLVFMHPDDFTPVCTTELGQAAKMQDEFAKRNVKMVGYSCNDHQTHWHWIKDIFIATGGYVRFPIFADPTRQTAIQLGILDKSAKDDEGLPLTLRAVYVLKPDKTIALTMTYPMSTGRNFDEILRIVDALQLTEKHSVATPANWTPGKDVIVNLGLDDEQADEKFGSDGWRAIQLPSEMEKRKKLIAEAEEMAKNDASGKEGEDTAFKEPLLKQHYLRYTPDPGRSSGQGGDGKAGTVEEKKNDDAAS